MYVTSGPPGQAMGIDIDRQCIWGDLTMMSGEMGKKGRRVLESDRRFFYSAEVPILKCSRRV